MMKNNTNKKRLIRLKIKNKKTKKLKEKYFGDQKFRRFNRNMCPKKRDETKIRIRKSCKLSFFFKY